MHTRSYIYKYAPTSEFTYKNLLLSQMWFNPPSALNDQLEGLVKVSNPEFHPSKKALKKFIGKERITEKYWRSPEGLIKEYGFLDFYLNFWFFPFELNNYRVSCFSKTGTESLMWAHYANKHSGVCLVYDQTLLFKTLQGIDNSFEIMPISYGQKPTITLFEEDDEIKYVSDIPIISTKDKNWKYEKEIRLFNKSETRETKLGQSFYIPNTALVAIIYGHQISKDDREAISLILMKEPLYRDVVEWDAIVDYETGKIVLEPFEER